MIHVRVRRRLAIAAIAIFLAASATATYVICSQYAPRSLRARAEAALAAATGIEIELGAASISINDTATFSGAAIRGNNGLQLVVTGPVEVAGLPKPFGPWLPTRIRLSDLSIGADLSDKGAGLQSVALLATLLDKAEGIEVVLPDEITVEVNYGDVKGEEFTAASAGFVKSRALDLTPKDRKAPNTHFTMTLAEAALSAPLGNADDLLTQQIAKSAGKSVLGDSPNASSGRLAARWTADGEQIEFANPDGWEIPASAAEAFGFKIGDGKATIRVTAFTVKDGQVTALDGSFEYGSKAMQSKTIAGWLDALGMKGLDAPGTPPRFENVQMAGAFTLKDGFITVKPLSGKPALVWSEVAGARIVLFNGEGRVALSDFTAKMTGKPAGN
jgi:hypothetical protein